MKIIFNADDYGYSKGVNLGIIEAYENGLVRSATMMANMPGFEHAVLLLKASPGLKIGVHLVLTSGPSLGGPYKTITDDEGNFLPQVQIAEKARKGLIDQAEVEKEYILQIEKILAAGITPTHFDGHHHSHCLPGILDVFLKLAKKYEVAVRLLDRSVLADEYANIKTAAFNGTFYGDSVTLEHLFCILENCNEDTEIMCHPAYLDNFAYTDSSYNIVRMKELELLTSQEAKILIKRFGHVLCSFEDIYS